MKNITPIKLSAKSKSGPADWYGDFDYLHNPLEHWSNCNFAKVEYDYGSSHGYGIRSITVETSEEFVKLMGWDDDLKYKVE